MLKRPSCRQAISNSPKEIRLHGKGLLRQEIYAPTTTNFPFTLFVRVIFMLTTYSYPVFRQVSVLLHTG